MDLPLLQTLQSIKRIEDAHPRDYQSKTIDLATFVPKYPNVIIVDQRFHDPRINDDVPCVPCIPRQTTNCETGPILNEFITNKIGHALVKAAFVYGVHATIEVTSVESWTIILKEGLYIFEDYTMMNFGFLKLHLEFVGLHHVRFLLQQNLRSGRPLFKIPKKQFSLNNVRVYDMRKYQICAGVVIHGTPQSQLFLSNVFIHSTSSFGVCVRRSSCSIKDSAFSGCERAFVATQHAELHVENCVARDIKENLGNIGFNSALYLSKSRCVNQDKSVYVHGKSICVIDRCRFEIERWKAEDRDDYAIDVGDESHLSCKGTAFQGFKEVVNVSGSNTSASLNTCVVMNALRFADVIENASFTASECVLDCSNRLLVITLNVKGKVQFTKNRLSGSTPRKIAIDKISKPPKHDVDGVTFEGVESYVPMWENGGKLDQEMSAYTRSVKQQVDRLSDQLRENLDLASLMMSGNFKSCLKCQRGENFYELLELAQGIHATLSEKYRYCSRCRRACYCSKECQDAHWPDHRLMCKIKRS